MEKQFIAEGLTREESQKAYAEIKERFGLKAAQRNKLDVSEAYSSILRSAHQGRWHHVEAGLILFGIVGA